MLKTNVVTYDPAWLEQFAIESELVTEALKLEAIHHIGSTAIPGIYAKPIVDMLGEASDLVQVDLLIPQFERLSYEAMGEFGIAGRRYFRKDIDGVRRFHLHVFEKDSDEAKRHIRFRDFLIKHPEEAKRYSDLKRKLTAECDGDMEKYMDGKDAFIKEIDRRAGIED